MAQVSGYGPENKKDMEAAVARQAAEQAAKDAKDGKQ